MSFGQSVFLQLAQVAGAFFRNEHLVLDRFVRFNAKHRRQLDIVTKKQLLPK